MSINKDIQKHNYWSKTKITMDVTHYFGVYFFMNTRREMTLSQNNKHEATLDTPSISNLLLSWLYAKPCVTWNVNVYAYIGLV